MVPHWKRATRNHKEPQGTTRNPCDRRHVAAETKSGLDVRNDATVPPSNKARNARMRKGAVFPTNSYITLPNGGPTVGDALDGK
ncbi:hypothetical protein EYF80_042781 [Liparis tanakae]|uniref:Uncharacterized protein n=1 Tax=Liparis tanakae TaxID=230148 RepID=A0A4Z2G1H6_9TELE|nr:hypothetical protein EYF80_042781 [Liparis tanakae]